MNKKYVSNYTEDCVGKYFKEVKKSELLSLEEEIILANKIKMGDESAIEQLVNSNLKFVISIAKEYQNQGIPLSDLISEGNYGLIKAAKRFDVERGFRFISYAVWWIRQSIIQSLNDNSRTIRLPTNVILNMSKIRKELVKFEFDNGRELRVGEELRDENNELLKFVKTPVVTSLNTIINEDGTSELSDLIAGYDDNIEVEVYNSENKLKKELNETLSILSDRERDIIESYYGINNSDTGLTLEDIGSKYGLTKERIRQIKERAIRKLRHNSHNLFDLLNT
jgi:RNA polymerase primary sigma factor